MAVSLLVCCNGRHGYDRSFTDSDVVSLTVNKVKVFEYDPMTCQLGYNDAKREFRVSTDNMSDYFVITLSKIPTSKEEQVTGSISWTGADYIRDLSNQTFETVKVDRGKIWLWNQANKLAVIIPIME
jgi:hypothetical protein